MTTSNEIGTTVRHWDCDDIWTVVEAKPIEVMTYRIKTGIDTYRWVYAHDVTEVVE